MYRFSGLLADVVAAKIVVGGLDDEEVMEDRAEVCQIVQLDRAERGKRY